MCMIAGFEVFLMIFQFNTITLYHFFNNLANQNQFLLIFFYYFNKIYTDIY